jgi:uracil-DNA glycosylase
MTREEILESKLGEWWPFLKEEFDKPYLINIANQVQDARERTQVFPGPDEVFRAFKETSPYKLKAVIVGQDPYHDGNATGLAFECGKSKAGQGDVTPSWKKMLRGYDEQFPTSFANDLYEGDLTRWAHSGVLLLNSALTVVKGTPGSHSELWKPFTSAVISLISRSKTPRPFLFLGRKAQAFQPLVKSPHHSLYREHPAAALYQKEDTTREGRDWEHGRCFIVMNEFLKQNNIEPIDW